MKRYLVFTILALSVFFIPGRSFAAKQFQVDSAGTLTTNLDAYYKYDADASDFWSTHNQTNTGPTLFNAGKINNAADFGASNTSKWLHNADALGINGGPISLSAWVNVTTVPNNQTYTAVDVDSGTSDVGYYLEYGDSAGTKKLDFTRDRLCTALNQASVNTTLTPGTWYHLVGTYDGSILSLYLNDVLQATTTASGTGSCNQDEIDTGARNNGATNKLSGLVDEVGVWSKALSMTEISDLYNGSGSGAGQTMVTTPSLSLLQQGQSDGTTGIASGGTTSGNTVVFHATLNSSSTSNVQLQAEVKSTGIAFSNMANVTSTFVSPGSNATATFSGSNGNYHWQARVVDANGVSSTWQTFGANATSTIDFVVAHISSTTRFQVDSGGTLRDGLSAYYRLENTSDFWSTHNLINNGSTPFDAGKISNAADFGASNTTRWLHNSDAIGINGGGISLSAWVNIATTPSNQTYTILDTDSGTSDVGYYLEYSDSGGTKTIDFTRDRLCTVVSRASDSTTLTPGTWYHLAGTYDGTNVKLYLNGSLVGGPTLASGNGSCNQDEIEIGSRNNGVTNKLSGLIDEAGVWSRALIGTEVSDLYNGSGSGAGQTMVGPPGSLSSLNQYKTNGTAIPSGGATSGNAVVFKATLNSSTTNNLQLQAEVQLTGTVFSGTANATSTFVVPGNDASATFSGSRGDYHWQARVIDTDGVTSTWQTFGVNSTSTIDFVIH